MRILTTLRATPHDPRFVQRQIQPGQHATLARASRRRLAGAGLLCLAMAGLAGVAVLPTAALAQTKAAACPSLLQSTQPRLQDERPVPLCSYAGKVLLVVNTASFCGFTPQYRALEALHARYEARGLAVLGFPSNDFGNQEPGSAKDIAQLCENTFGVRFPMFAKSQVVARSGAAPGTVNPLFTALAERSGQAPKWNFHKYLVSRDGREVRSFASDLSPDDPKLIRDLERLLRAN